MTLDPDVLIAHAGFVRRVAAALLDDESQVEDVLQQAMLEALERPPRHAHALRAWLRKVTVNLCRKSVRDESRSRNALGSLAARARDDAAGSRAEARRAQATPTPADLLAKSELIRTLGQAVATLGEPYRSTLILRFYDGLSFERIAVHAGIPVKTARTRLYRALEQLRSRLDRAHGGERDAWLPAMALLDGRPAADHREATSTTQAGPTEVGRPRIARLPALASVALIGGAALLTYHLATRPEPAFEPKSPARETVVMDPVEAGTLEGLTVVPGLSSPDEPGRRPDEVPGQAKEPESGSLRVQVLWSDGSPASGVKARVLPGAAIDGRRMEFAGQDLDLRTGEDGVLIAAGLPPGKAVLLLDRMQVRQTFLVQAARTTDAVVRLRAGVTLRILVVDPSSRPVEDAEIVLDSRLRSADSGVTVGRTGPDGRFVLRELGNERYVGAKAPPYAPSLFTRVDGMSQVGSLELTCELGPAGGALHGRVVDASLHPVADASILLEDLRPTTTWPGAGGGVVGIAPPFRTRTDADGLFRLLGIQPGRMLLLVTAPGHPPFLDRIQIEPSSLLEPRIVLPAAVTVKGTVSCVDGRLVAGAKITAVDPAVCPYRAASWTTSDEQGRFTLGHLVPGAILLEVDGTGNQGRARMELNGAPGEVIEVAPVLSPGRQIRGRVATEKGDPLAGWRVVVRTPTAEPPREWRNAPHRTVSDVDLEIATATTDEGGRFRIANRPVTPHRVEVYEPGQWCSLPCGSREGVLPDGPELELRVPEEARPSAFLRGRIVFSDGSPFRSATLECAPDDLRHSFSADRTGTDGSFVLGPLRAGSYRITASLEVPDPDMVYFPAYRLGHRYSSDPGRPDAWRSPASSHALGVYRLAPGEDRDLGTLVLGRPGSLSARILSEEDIPLDGALVTILDRFKETLVRCPFDGDRATCEGLFPGLYYLQISGLGAAAVGSTLRPFEVRPGEETSFDVVMKPGSLCRFVCVEPEGPRWTTLLSLEIVDDGGEPVWCFKSSRHQGRFVYGLNLSPGTYTIRGEADSRLGFEQRIRVRPRQERRPAIRLSLRPQE